MDGETQNFGQLDIKLKKINIKVRPTQPMSVETQKFRIKNNSHKTSELSTVTVTVF